jgi:PKD repeat protein
MSLEVDPSTWQMTGGNSTSLLATWVGTPSGCGLAPIWFHWSLPTPPDSGQLNATSGPEVSFVGDGADPGTTAISVEGVALLDCAAGDQPVVANASASVTVVANLALGNISVDPAPLAPGQVATLTASVSGGTAPYTIEIDWGDGTTSTTGLAAAGLLSTTHVYPDAGEYTPSVTAVDAGGLLAHTTDPVTIDVSGGAAVAIFASPQTTDTGGPVVWNVTVDRDPLEFDPVVACDGQIVLPLPGPNATMGTCTFPRPGHAIISVVVVPGFGERAAEASTAVLVVPPPSVTVATPESPGEVGFPSELVVNVEGGVPPFSLACAGPDLLSPPHLEIGNDGTVSVPIDPAEVGRLDYTIQVEDADELVSPPVLVTLLVDPALNASFVEGRTLNATGANLSLAGTVLSGVGPFAWSVVPSVPGSGPPWAAGILEQPGPLGWSATYPSEEPVTVRVLVADSAGSVLEDAWVAPVVSPLAISVTPRTNGTGPPDPLALSIGIAGGLAPFNVTVSTAAGPVGSMSVAADGTTAWPIPAGVAGTVPLAVVVRDSAGDTAWANTTVTVPVARSSTTVAVATSLTWAVVALAVLVGAVVFAAVWARRRRPTAPPASVDPTSVLRAILTPADGAERTSVELLAEEEGVPLETVRSTLDRLIEKGAVRSETDADGVEVLSWAREATP